MLLCILSFTSFLFLWSFFTRKHLFPSFFFNLFHSPYGCGTYEQTCTFNSSVPFQRVCSCGLGTLPVVPGLVTEVVIGLNNSTIKCTGMIFEIFPRNFSFSNIKILVLTLILDIDECAQYSCLDSRNVSTTCFDSRNASVPGTDVTSIPFNARYCLCSGGLLGSYLVFVCHRS